MSAPTTSIRLTSTTPAAPTGNQNVVPQSDGAAPQQAISFYPQPATASLLGVVKPDGTSITVDGTGTISASGGTGALLNGSGPPATPAFIQAASGGGDSLAFTSAVASGDLLVVAFKSEGAIGSITVSDTLGTSYMLATSITGEANNIAIYYGLAPSSGSNTVTIGSAPNSFDRIAVSEFSGVSATVDVTASVFNGGGTNPETLSITTTAAGDLLVLAVAGFHNVNTFSFTGGFTLDSQSNGSDANAIGHQIAEAAGSYTASVDITSAGADNSALLLVAFTAGAAPGVDGDFYLDTVNGVLYGPRTGGSYSAIASGIVPQGSAGQVLATPAGASGAASLRALAASDLPFATTSAAGVVKPDGTTITISGGVISAAGGSGDATEIQSVAVSNTAPTTGQVLAYDGTEWAPANASGGGGGGANGTEASFTTPVLSDFTDDNWGAGTAATSMSSGILFTDPGVGGNTNNLRSLLVAIPTPASPWTLTARFCVNSMIATFNQFGLVLKDSVGGRYWSVGLGGDPGPLEWVKWNNANSFNDDGNVGNSGRFGSGSGPNFWLRLVSDGTTLSYSYSRSGNAFVNIGSSPLTSFLPNAPDFCGIGMNTNVSSGLGSCCMECYSFSLTQP